MRCWFHFAKQIYYTNVIFICGWKSCWRKEVGHLNRRCSENIHTNGRSAEARNAQSETHVLLKCVHVGPADPIYKEVLLSVNPTHILCVSKGSNVILYKTQ